jgi:hypothetical protein
VLQDSVVFLGVVDGIEHLGLDLGDVGIMAIGTEEGTELAVQDFERDPGAHELHRLGVGEVSWAGVLLLGSWLWSEAEALRLAEGEVTGEGAAFTRADPRLGVALASAMTELRRRGGHSASRWSRQSACRRT